MLIMLPDAISNVCKRWNYVMDTFGLRTLSYLTRLAQQDESAIGTWSWKHNFQAKDLFFALSELFPWCNILTNSDLPAGGPGVPVR